MSEGSPQVSPASEPPLPDIDRRRRWLPSLVWAIPLLAAVIGLSLVVQEYRKRGPEIFVSFATAEGIEPGKTKVKFKSVDIGDVLEVTLSPDRSRAVARIELSKDAAAFAASDSRFWVVRPRLAGSTVSGLGTLLSGSYIAVDGGKSSTTQTDFTGLEEPPIIASDIPGREFQLTADDIGSLEAGSPVYFRRLQVGHVVSFSLHPDGKRIDLRVFVQAPYDRFVTEDTRFWHASGVDLQMGADGIKLQTQSLVSILMGGIAFETPSGPAADPTKQAKAGTSFALAPNRDVALHVPDTQSETVVFRFKQSVRGLSVGAPVDFRGLEIGTVRSIDVVFDARTQEFSSPVVVDLYPGRLRIENGERLKVETSDAPRAFLADMVKRGLRGQLRSGSLLTGQLYVALDFFPDASPEKIEAGKGVLVLPTVPGDLQELQAQVASILKKLDAIPFETLGQDLHRTLASMEGALKRLDGTLATADKTLVPQVTATMVEVRKTMETVDGALAGDAPLQQDTRRALNELTAATRSLKMLSDLLERNPESLVRGRKGDDK